MAAARGRKPGNAARLAAPLAAGVFSGALFAAVAKGYLGGFLFVYLPLLPLFALGLALGAKPAAIAAVAGMAGCLLFTGDGGALLSYTLLQALPAVYILHKGLLSRPAPAVVSQGVLIPAREWYPLGYVVGTLTLYAAVVFMSALVVAASGVGFEQLIQQNLDEAARNFPEYEKDLRDLFARFGFVVVPVAVLGWEIMVFFYLFLAQWLVRYRGRNIRPRLSFAPYDPASRISLLLLMLSGLLTFAGSPEAVFSGRALLLIFLIPYLLSGLLALHSSTLKLPGRPYLLGAVYVFTVLLVWPAALIAVVEVVRKIWQLGKSATGSQKNGER